MSSSSSVYLLTVISFGEPSPNLRAPEFNRFHSRGTECPACSQYKLITNRVPYPILLYNWPFIIAGTHHRPWLISRIYSPIIMLINLCFPILYTNSYLSPDKSISYFFRQINWTAMVEYDLPLQKKMFLSVSWDISCSWQWYTVKI